MEDTRRRNVENTNLIVPLLKKHLVDTCSSFHYHAQNLYSFSQTDFLASDPCVEHIAAAIKNDQVCVCAEAECAFPILNAPREYPVKREKSRTQVPKVTTLPASVRQPTVSTDHAGDAPERTCQQCTVSAPASKYNLTPSFTSAGHRATRELYL